MEQPKLNIKYIIENQVREALCEFIEHRGKNCMEVDEFTLYQIGVKIVHSIMKIYNTD